MLTAVCRAASLFAVAGDDDDDEEDLSDGGVAAMAIKPIGRSGIRKAAAPEQRAEPAKSSPSDVANEVDNSDFSFTSEDLDDSVASGRLNAEFDMAQNTGRTSHGAAPDSDTEFTADERDGLPSGAFSGGDEDAEDFHEVEDARSIASAERMRRQGMNDRQAEAQDEEEDVDEDDVGSFQLSSSSDADDADTGSAVRGAGARPPTARRGLELPDFEDDLHPDIESLDLLSE